MISISTIIYKAVINIKTFNEIYNSIKDKFYKRTKLDIEKGSVIDMFTASIADEISQAHQTIEDNKKPYLFTTQTGDELDSTGYFVSCPRYEGESDSNYLSRLIKWNANNASCNSTAIDNACKSLKYSNAANYVSYTKGVGTGTIYLIPLSYTPEDIELCLNEAQEKVSVVINPASRVEFKVPEPRYVRLVAYIDFKEDSDEALIKKNLIQKIKDYINSIAPGDKLYLGQINKIGLSPKEVEYFNVVQVYVNDDEATDFEILQTTEAKFLFDEIIWWNVEG